MSFPNPLFHAPPPADLGVIFSQLLMPPRRQIGEDMSFPNPVFYLPNSAGMGPVRPGNLLCANSLYIPSRQIGKYVLSKSSLLFAKSSWDGTT